MAGRRHQSPTIIDASLSNMLKSERRLLVPPTEVKPFRAEVMASQNLQETVTHSLDGSAYSHSSPGSATSTWMIPMSVFRSISLHLERSGEGHGICKSSISSLLSLYVHDSIIRESRSALARDTFHQAILCDHQGRSGANFPKVFVRLLPCSCFTAFRVVHRWISSIQCAIYSFNAGRFYIYPPASLFSKPILLVPETQVQDLLDEINSAFKISIKLPREPFLLAFHQDGTPVPEPLGISQSREAIAEMQQKIPAPAEDYGECPANASPELERCFEQFKLKMERASAEVKRKGAAVKKAKAKNRLAAHVNSCDALKRGQRYLGLRPIDCQGGLPLPDTSLSWDEQQRLEREQKIRYGHILQPLNVGELAPHPFDRDVILISVDVESYERNHDLITEVGISSLDTADIKSVIPGNGGFNWMEYIRSRHFRISNHVHLRNTTFCTGDPEKFLFGHSEFVSMKEIGRAVDLCFEPPYSADFVHKGEFRAGDHSSILEEIKTVRSPNHLRSVQGEQLEPESQGELIGAQDLSSTQRGRKSDITVAKTVSPSELPKETKAGQGYSVASNSNNVQATDVQPTQSAGYRSDKSHHRNIILVGHDLDGDLQYLSTLQSNIFHKDPPAVDPQSSDLQQPSRRPILESLDTAKLYQAWKREANITSLAKVLVGVERTGWHLHNGGNDARYTLEALIGILLGSRVEEGMRTGHGEAEQAQELERRIKDKQKAVEKEERENFAMWKHAMGDQVDDEKGGVLLDPYTPATAEQGEKHQAASGTGQGNANANVEPPNSLNDSNTIPARDPSEAQPHPWSSGPRATLDGGDPRAFQMPITKSEKVKSSSRRRERDELLKLQEEGETGRAV